MDGRIRKDRKRLRQAILAQLSQRQMTFAELAEEVDHLSPANQVRRELLNMVGEGLVCSLETKKGKHDLFETWERALKRVKAKDKGTGRSAKPRKTRAQVMA